MSELDAARTTKKLLRKCKTNPEVLQNEIIVL